MSFIPYLEPYGGNDVSGIKASYASQLTLHYELKGSDVFDTLSENHIFNHGSIHYDD